MSIVRERDYWQAKRDIVSYEKELERLDATPGELRDFWWEDRYSVVFNDMAYLREIVAERENTQTRPCDVERPANETSLDQWVSA